MLDVDFIFHPRSNEKTTYGLIFLIRKIQGVVFGEREFTEHGDSLGVSGRTMSKESSAQEGTVGELKGRSIYEPGGV